VARGNAVGRLPGGKPDEGELHVRFGKREQETERELPRLLPTSPSRPIAVVARDLNINEGTLGNWVVKYRVEHAGEEPPLTISDRARLRELEKEVRELRLEKEFLGKAAAFFASEYR
jgi:transposase